MLQQLHILNYAIIDELEVSFGPQLNIITGETGAGKSILMGALNLILGGRADSSVLVDKEKKCVIEGTFKTSAEAIGNYLKENDLDEADSLLIRREINASGKSRAFINDTPVTLAQLQDLAGLLVDLHQQFDTLDLGTADFQREVVDALAQTGPLLHQYRSAYQQAQAAQKKWAALKAQQDAFSKEGDYLRFLHEELSEAGFKEQEVEDLENESRLLEHSEGIKSVLSTVCFALSEGEQPMVQQLKTLLHQLQTYQQLLPGLPALSDRLGSVQIELQDIASELESLQEQVSYDPERAETINERISLGYKLFKKHGVRDTAGLLALQTEISTKLQNVLHLDEDIAGAEKEQERQTKIARDLAVQLSRKRSGVLSAFEGRINELLARVGMPNARLKAQLKEGPLGPYGMDQIEFLFDANKSNRFEPIRKVASGGELSRLMLSIKSQVAGSMQMPTLIFDEIDTGISGEAARQVGIIMKELASGHQVICITHQPQIAAKADAHYFVYKQEENNAIRTRVRRLEGKERVEAIARMLSGEQLNEGILKVAREMILN
jgi:DNA repair protein RecN (Recombination protein N)